MTRDGIYSFLSPLEGYPGNGMLMTYASYRPRNKRYLLRLRVEIQLLSLTARTMKTIYIAGISKYMQMIYVNMVLPQDVLAVRLSSGVKANVSIASIAGIASSSVYCARKLAGGE